MTRALGEHGSDRLIPFVVLLLPAVNLALWWAINSIGGAHGHAAVAVAGVLGLELIAIAWFCATQTQRAVLPWAIGGLLIDVAVSVVAIYVFVFVFLLIGYSAKGGGD